jgi:hypothetical protein
MKVYLTPPQPSRGLQRIADALVKWKPDGVEVVSDEREAELVVLYAIGRNGALVRKAVELQGNKQKYAVIQVCLRSTMKPRTDAWLHLWWAAEVVWSYYDLNAAITVDGSDDRPLLNFYHAPLGADAEVFRDPFVSERWESIPRNGRNFIITTSGLSRLSESVRECWLAAKEVDGKVFHVGPSIRTNQLIQFSRDCTDIEMAIHYAASQFVSALRRTEGFELPAVEGLLCGARPICFSTRDYRTWYEPFAEFIEEGSRADVVESLVKLFKQGARPVTEDELALARERFNWKTIIEGFYSRVQ